MSALSVASTQTILHVVGLYLRLKGPRLLVYLIVGGVLIGDLVVLVHMLSDAKLLLTQKPAATEQLEQVLLGVTQGILLVPVLFIASVAFVFSMTSSATEVQAAADALEQRLAALLGALLAEGFIRTLSKISTHVAGADSILSPSGIADSDVGPRVSYGEQQERLLQALNAAAPSLRESDGAAGNAV